MVTRRFTKGDMVRCTYKRSKYHSMVGEVVDMKRVKMDIYFPATDLTTCVLASHYTLCDEDTELLSLPNSGAGRRMARMIENDEELDQAMSDLCDAMVNCGISASDPLFFIAFRQRVSETERLVDLKEEQQDSEAETSVASEEIPEALMTFGEAFAKKVHPKATFVPTCRIDRATGRAVLNRPDLAGS